MTYSLIVAGEDISAGDEVAVSPRDGKLYSVRTHVATRPFPVAASAIREGFRAQVSETRAEEDDA